MKYLSRKDLEYISAIFIEKYKLLPHVAGQPLDRIDIDRLVQEVLGLHVAYSHLSLDRERIGLTSSCEVGVGVFPDNPTSPEDYYFLLDGKTLLIESDLMGENGNIGRRNYTVAHESCHHILKRLFPEDYGAQPIHYCYRSNRRKPGDWEEWQVETLAAMILLPAECVYRSMQRYGLGNQLRLLNRVFAASEYKKFVEMAAYMGVSKTALSIRMTQLGFLKRNDLADPYALVRIEVDEEDYGL